jgi:hypothetical protein
MTRKLVFLVLHVVLGVLLALAHGDDPNKEFKSDTGDVRVVFPGDPNYEDVSTPCQSVFCFVRCCWGLTFS